LKLVQVAHAISPCDAASNQIIAMDKLFKKLGYKSEIYAGKVHAFNDIVQPFSNFVNTPDTQLIYHYSTGTSFTNKIMKYPGNIALYYHNITPAKYYFGNAWGSFLHCLKGRLDLDRLLEKTNLVWGASNYSLQECNTSQKSVLPIILDYDKYLNESINHELFEQYNDGYLNILFVGRVVPHKGQLDLIKTIDYYQKNINSKIRLLLVGSQKGSYIKKLREVLTSLGTNVELVGQVNFHDLCTFYRLADVFLCMSEHEGFCVPLVEAMLFNKPILAYSASAVPETVGDAGVLFTNKNHQMIAEQIYEFIKSDRLISKQAKNRQDNLRRFHLDNIIKNLDKDLKLLASAGQ